MSKHSEPFFNVYPPEKLGAHNIVETQNTIEENKKVGKRIELALKPEKRLEEAETANIYRRYGWPV